MLHALPLVIVAALAQQAPAANPINIKPPFTLEGHELVLPSPITFATGKPELAPDSKAAIDHVVAYLREKTFITTLRIEAHTDDPAGQKLSEERALAVAKAIVAGGIGCERLIAVGFGATKPIASNDTPDGKAKNRRITVVNAGMRGRAIGGMPMDGGGVVAGDACAKPK